MENILKLDAIMGRDGVGSSGVEATVMHSVADLDIRLFARIFDTIHEGVIVSDAENNIEFVNPAFTQITGYTREEVSGKNMYMLYSGLMEEPLYRFMWHSINETGRWQGEMANTHKNGTSYVEWLSIHTLKDEQGLVSHYITIFSDISERKTAEARLVYMAKHDVLTDLPNRVLLQDRLTQAIIQAEQEKCSVAVMLMDIDRFKVVNDALGHLVGDKLLQEVANRIRETVRVVDTVSRQGGDEFVIMLPNIIQTSILDTIAPELLKAVSAPYLINGNEIEVTTSIGISLYPNHGQDSDVLLKHADAAMYYAKEVGRNNYQFFTREMRERAQEHMAIEKKLRRALERNELCLHYQPQVDLRNGQIIGVESLLRWNHPESGMISPGQFIPVAEENGMIVPIGEWVLLEACRQNQVWREMGFPEITMAVNLSAVQFRQKNLGNVIVAALYKSGLDASGLELEITEGAVMQDAESAISLLRVLKDFGVNLSIDDFGTGYSSLSYLKKFPINKLKIDQSFVRDATIDSDDAAITSTIISMGRNLKLKVIAEGVETAEQLTFLKQHGCDEMQGYLFSRPISAEQFSRLMASARESNGQWHYDN
ncbi:MAG: EAL domain-containing protein [Candidatus Nitrotoga sp.]